MDHELLRVAERLAVVYDGRLPVTTVIRLLHECHRQSRDQTPERLEAAVRARLDNEIKPSLPPQLPADPQDHRPPGPAPLPPTPALLIAATSVGVVDETTTRDPI